MSLLKNLSLHEIKRIYGGCSLSIYFKNGKMLITTHKASTEYWSENSDQWASSLKKQIAVSRGRGSAKSVLCADAWWAYQGFLMSGCNAICGAGMAALASGCTYLWG